MALPELFSNFFQTSLSQACGASDTTIQLSATAPVALQTSPGQFRILVESELMLVTAGASTESWTVTRGVGNTVAVAHGAGVDVTHIITAEALGNQSDAVAGTPALRSLGAGATQAAAGTAPAAAQAAAVALSAQRASNLSDLADAGSSRVNLHVPALTPVACVATTNLALTGLQTIDGRTLVAGDLVLLTGQSTASQNGLWTAASGAWARPTEMATGSALKSRTVAIIQGTAHAGETWLLQTNSSVTVDTTSQTWVVQTPVSVASGTSVSGGDTGLLWNGTAWVSAKTLAAPSGMTAQDLVLGLSGTAVGRLPVGNNGQQLIVRSDGTLNYITPAKVNMAYFGVKADWNATGNGITITSGALNQGVMTSIPADLIVGKMMDIDGLTAPVQVQSINAGTKTLTFTAPASGAVAGAMCAWFTPNGAFLQAAFDAALSGQFALEAPAGRIGVEQTVGRLDGPTTGEDALTIYCGGKSGNSTRLALMSGSGGTTFVWGGPQGGTMFQWDRVSGVHWVGGLSLVGQASYDPSGFATYGTRCGLLYEVSQNSTPLTGTGSHVFDDVLISDGILGFQFGENVSDNNCDTSYWKRLIAARMNQVAFFKNSQSISHRFDWVQFVGCNRGIVTGGGALTIGDFHLSACNGSMPGVTLTSALTTGGAIASLPISAIPTACAPPGSTLVATAGQTVTLTQSVNRQTWTLTADVHVGDTALAVTSTVPNFAFPATFTVVSADNYQLEAIGTSSGVSYNIGMLRAEQSSAQLILVGATSQVTIANCHEEGNGGATISQKMFHVKGLGILDIVDYYGVSYSIGSTGMFPPFFMDAGSGGSGKLRIGTAILNGPGGIANKPVGVPNVWSGIFQIAVNALADIQIDTIKDSTGREYKPIRSKLGKGGPSFLYGQTTSAAAVTLGLFAGNQTVNHFGFAPYLQAGYTVLKITIVGKRSDGTYSRFVRTIEVSRATAASAVVVQQALTMVGADVVQGTDAVSGVTFDGTALGTLAIAVAGTTSITTNWTATVSLEGFGTDLVDV